MKRDPALTCQEILLKIIEICNNNGAALESSEPVLSFSPDWGGMTITMSFNTKSKQSHVHLASDDNFGGLVRKILDTLEWLDECDKEVEHGNRE